MSESMNCQDAKPLAEKDVKETFNGGGQFLVHRNKVRSAVRWLRGKLEAHALSCPHCQYCFKTDKLIEEAFGVLEEKS